ncbi:sensor histidine kinase [Hahella ganghwensis]|uniref:sensor histidine kinase n=1 Tax=Hahella ganghwensis TaxID=286420 RepID=UPI000362F2BF|nr:HAMP domain-containing sensor histidine kinase [Hahella ganghwensis]
MNFLQSLRFRILASCVIFALIVIVSYSLLVLFVAQINDDELFNWHIARETSHRAEAYINEHPQGVLAANEWTFAGTDRQFVDFLYSDLALFPGPSPSFQEDMTLEDLSLTENTSDTEQGFTIFELGSQNRKIHVVRNPLKSPRNKVNFYYLVDISGFDRQSTYAGFGSISLLGISIAFTLIIAVITGLGIARRVVAPLTHFSQDVDSATIEHKPVLKGHYYPDEVGFLADRINAMLRRIERFVDREKAFARDASHELRTPVTSSRMALELALPMTEDNEKLRNLLLRASRANKDMTHLIESFMLLGKEESHKEPAELCHLHALAQSALDKNAYLLRDKPIACINRTPENIQVEQPVQLLSIVLNNLLRNAFQYTHEGSVEICADGQHVTIQDTGKGFPSDLISGARESQVPPEGMGLGLNIVRRICQLRDWQLDIQPRQSGGTRITLYFQATP